ncbi:MAG TPA: hypothetical protein VFQ07_05145 [Candidatus Polarisedimenticolia bacterium]|nr:hypothetical protein [Candidatus Polarisedimenticolia bacterium]
MSARPERLILTLPPDPAFARLARLAALHFLRQQGARALEARRRARQVESRCKTALKAAARAAGALKPLAITFSAGATALLVVDKGGPRGRLLVVPRRKTA